MYNPFLSYGNENEPKSYYDERFVICNRFKTEDGLKEDAVKDVVNQLYTKIKNKIGVNDKIVITAFKDANFERLDSKENIYNFMIIQKITKKLVDNHYIVLERFPQALIRLAHESVFKKKEDGGLDKDHAEELEYGLTTENNGPENPLMYDIKLEGVKDREFNTFMNSDKGIGYYGFEGRKVDQAMDVEKFERERREFKIKNVKEMMQIRLRPLMIAKFKTSKYLLAIDASLPLIKRKGYYYNPKYHERVVKKSAVAKINARLLDKDSKIIWIDDLSNDEKKATDEILHYFDEYSRKPQTDIKIPENKPGYDEKRISTDLYREGINEINEILEKMNVKTKMN